MPNPVAVRAIEQIEITGDRETSEDAVEVPVPQVTLMDWLNEEVALNRRATSSFRAVSFVK